MAILYREVKFLLRKMREVRQLPEGDLADWTEQTAAEWAYLHLEHY